MAHIHSVYDTDKHFTIEPSTRALVNQTPEKACIMQYDHASERITFDLPADVEGHKILDCNLVEVHYLNIDVKTQEQRAGLYEVDDLQLSPADEAVAICSWLISMNATQLVGPLYFRVTFKCVTEGNIDYSWSTAVYKGLAVSDGINCTEYVADQYADILAQWRDDLGTSAEAIEASRAAAAKHAQTASAAAQTAAGSAQQAEIAAGSAAQSAQDAASAADTAARALLEEAKASGEFDGEDGKDGKDGDPGPAGPAYTLNDIDKNTIAAAVRSTMTAADVGAGIFAGQVVANASGQDAGTSLIRNSKLVNADTNPTVNGEICWTYK